MNTLTNEAWKVNTQEQYEKIWTFLNQIGFTFLAFAYPYFSINISKG